MSVASVETPSLIQVEICKAQKKKKKISEMPVLSTVFQSALGLR